MDDLNVSTTEEPVTEQAPTTIETRPAALPDNYLSDGYCATTEKGDTYLHPAYVSAYAQQIATSLSGIKPSDFMALMREMKRAKKRTLPYEARLTAVSEMLPKALALVRRKKAPKLLLDFVQANLNAVHDDTDWMAFYRHCEAVYGYLNLSHPE